jgi:hypothetical protein
MVRVGEKKGFEIIQADKIRAEELLPVKQTVKEGYKKGQQDKYKNHRQAGKYEKKNPETFTHFFTVHAYAPGRGKTKPPGAGTGAVFGGSLTLEASENQDWFSEAASRTSTF